MKRGLSRREILQWSGAAAASSLLARFARASDGSLAANGSNPGSMADHAAPKLDKVRFGMIGVGDRGGSHIAHLLLLDGVEITAIADPYKPAAEGWAARIAERGRKPPAVYAESDFDYRKLCDRDDVDAVIVSTPWEWHGRQCVEAMRAGKHVFVEVPAAVTLDELWQMVETSEATRRHCMMMENVCYGREELMVLNMCQQGVFGELLHGEASYIHDLRFQMHQIDHGTGSWRTYHYVRRNGNLYPTHGLGPICQYMDINRGDRLDYLSSVSSNARARRLYAERRFPVGHERRTLDFRCGDINTTIVRTVRGRTILVQWDEQLPRPYTRHNFIQGTKGCWGGFPNRLVIEDVTPTEQWTQGSDLTPFYERYEHPLWRAIGEEARKAGGHGGMDFVMLWRIVYCLRNGLPLDQDVYDAAAWSAIGPLSERSVANRGKTVDIPDFTRGAWRHRKPLKLHTA
ncbi:MAG: Gfo/Idh/MocA family oxidoreductase [Fimbriimonadales bacterium]|nr:Gfo/Idh/MocA family oxidoreductase [Fimbriimonadales bacterium]